MQANCRFSALRNQEQLDGVATSASRVEHVEQLCCVSLQNKLFFDICRFINNEKRYIRICHRIIHKNFFISFYFVWSSFFTLRPLLPKNLVSFVLIYDWQELVSSSLCWMQSERICGFRRAYSADFVSTVCSKVWNESHAKELYNDKTMNCCLQIFIPVCIWPNPVWMWIDYYYYCYSSCSLSHALLVNGYWIATIAFLSSHSVYDTV